MIPSKIINSLWGLDIPHHKKEYLMEQLQRKKIYMCNGEPATTELKFGDKKLDYLHSVDDCIKEEFKNSAMGYGYHKRIIVKREFIGYTDGYGMVFVHKNKFGILFSYECKKTYKHVVTDSLPKLVA